MRQNDDLSLKACEEVQAVVTRLPPHVSIEVRDIAGAEATGLGVSMAPILRIQIGGHTPQWLVHIDRGSLALRLVELGIALHE